MNRQTINAGFIACVLLSGVVVIGQSAPGRVERPWFSDVLPPEEFAARRARVLAEIEDGVAVLQGAAERPAEAPFRQNSQFFYLSGVEVPRAILVLDGRTKASVLYLPDNSRRARAWGPMLEAGHEAATTTGIESVLPREAFDAAVASAARDRRVVYTPLRPEVLGSGSAGDAAAWAKATAADPWDGRPSREQAFVEKLHENGIGEIRDLDPLLDRMRFVKSPREIAVVREVTRITGLGIMEAMREAAPACMNTSSSPRPSTSFASTARRAPPTSRSRPPAGTRSIRTIIAAPRR